MRKAAAGLFDLAVKAADPGHALQSQLNKAPFPLPKPGGRVLLISVGKAAVPMMKEALRHLEGPEAILVTNYENHMEIPGVTAYASGHPVPDENGAVAARAVITALAKAKVEDQVIALISGGGSALLPAPAPGLSLGHKSSLNRLMLAGGFGITQMNLVRQQVSQLKGGGFLRLAAPAPVTAYILSDVIGDDLRVIASGPTTAPLGTAAEAAEILRAGGVWESLPAEIRAHLTRDTAAQTPPKPATNLLIGSNGQSLAAVLAAAKGYDARIVSDALIGDVEQACEQIMVAARAAPKGRPICLIFGGETTVIIRGNGLGGRNQELALRVAIAAQGSDRNWVFLSGGTDGRDGPTDAAGGLVDCESLLRMQAAGVDSSALLANNDSNAALRAAGDLLVTGATGTNVADVQIMLIAP